MPLTLSDMTALDALVRDVCRAEVLPRFGRLLATDVSAKTTADDLVTVADIAAERAITGGIRTLFPDAAIIGEETMTRDFDYATPERLFVIDPVDGTWNFAKGLPVFGAMVAVMERGRTVAGLIHHPVQGESLIGILDGGVHRTDAAGAVTALPPLTGGPVTSVMIAISQLSPARRIAAMTALADVPRLVTVQCSAYEYRLLLGGEVDAVISVGLNPWDHAGGQMMLAELGGASVLTGGGRWPSVMTGDLMISARDAGVAGDICRRLRDAGI